jgi:glycosyltransferase involved in cell wall biosynthesis
LRVSLLTSARTWRGSTVSLAHIARGLIARGHHAELLMGEESVAEIARETGLQASVLPTRNTGPAEIHALRGALARSQAEALITDRPRDLRLGALASVGKRLALLYRYNVSRPRPPSDLVTRLSYRRVATTVFRSQVGAEQVLAAAPFMARRPWRVISGGVDTTTYFPDPAAGVQFRQRQNLGPGVFLLAVGALMPEKRYPEMFAALAKLASPPLLLVFGEGRLEGELKALASHLSLDVRFLGLVPPADLRAAFAAATAVIHTCQVETFGLSVAEAMACGKAVVVCGGGALDEVVADAGVVVQGSDPETFARSLTPVLDDSALRDRLGTAARTRSVSCYSVDHVVDEYDRLLSGFGRSE